MTAVENELRRASFLDSLLVFLSFLSSDWFLVVSPMVIRMLPIKPITNRSFIEFSADKLGNNINAPTVSLDHQDCCCFSSGFAGFVDATGFAGVSSFAGDDCGGFADADGATTGADACGSDADDATTGGGGGGNADANSGGGGGVGAAGAAGFADANSGGGGGVICDTSFVSNTLDNGSVGGGDGNDEFSSCSCFFSNAVLSTRWSACSDADADDGSIDLGFSPPVLYGDTSANNCLLSSLFASSLTELIVVSSTSCLPSDIILYYNIYTNRFALKLLKEATQYTI